MFFPREKVFIIAEISANHNNDYDLAVRTIGEIAKSGADAVKVQTYRPESLAIDVDNEYFGPKTTGLWKGMRPWDLYKVAAMPYGWQPELKKVAENAGLVFFSSPFDLEAVDFLEDMGVELYKIASFEINDIPLIRKVAATGKPMIISTGVAEQADIRLALEVCYGVGNKDVSLLKCTSEYPAQISAANLATIPDLKNRFGVNVGVSDHTMGSLVPVVAVALGATIVEKHFIVDRSLGGVDSYFSMEPAEFKQMVDQIRSVEQAIGTASYEVSAADCNRRRSLFAIRDILPGERLTPEAIRSVRPGVGIPPKYYEEILGRTARIEIKKGTPLSFDFFL
ncbi:pseudaminic acid synthase [Accumulibacter sp.]|uniref:pseudaminic acid synthase n=1 Tax=Accumulibacter sp. TaxID=2053492 RepID=UPI002607BE9E|nr:pseudaminic acid synthase [Accumulibacter sp.]